MKLKKRSLKTANILVTVLIYLNSANLMLGILGIFLLNRSKNKLSTIEENLGQDPEIPMLLNHEMGFPLLLVIITTILLQYVLLRSKKMIRLIDRDSIFTTITVKEFRTIANCIIVLILFNWLSHYFAPISSSHMNTGAIHDFFMKAALVVGMYVLADIFSVGVSMKEESELTI